MSVAGTSDNQPFLSGTAPPQAGVFTVPSRPWNATNLMFQHNIAGKKLRELPKAPHTDARRFEVPIEKVADITEFVYGAMPQAMTLRPLEETGCCSCDRRYDLARDMFAEPLAEVKVAIPKMVPMFMCGCTGADVEVTPKEGQSGVSYKGVMKRTFLPGCLDNSTEVIWEGQANKPKMTFRAPAQCDGVKICMGQTIFTGWRGTSEAVPQSQALYDSSIILNCQNLCAMCSMQCTGCKNMCCEEVNFAPRWVRPDDVRRLVLTKYDYEFAHRQLDEELQFEMAEGEVGELNLLQIMQPIHKVDALYTGRLYMKMQCGTPYVKFADSKEGNIGELAAVDARYRGSLDHANPSEDDHLVVLGGLIMHAMWTFPNKAKAPYNLGPADMLRGQLLARDGVSGGPTPTNAV